MYMIDIFLIQSSGTCPHHLIVLEIPTDVGAAAADPLNRVTIKPGDASPLTAKSPADTMKNAKHPLSVSSYEKILETVILPFQWHGVDV